MARSTIQATGEGKEAGQNGKAYVPSRMFDVHRWTDYPELENCIGELCCEIEATEERRRARNAGAAKSFRAAVRCLALDLYVAWLSDPDLQIGVELNSNKFASETRYDALFLAYRTFKPAFDGLERLGYLRIDKRGYRDPLTGAGKVTRIRATKKLIDRLTKAGASQPAITRRKGVETIILKAPKERGKKKTIDYDETPFTEDARKKLELINEKLSSHWYDLDVSPELYSRSVRQTHAGDSRGRGIMIHHGERKEVLHGGSDWGSGGLHGGRSEAAGEGKPGCEADAAAAGACGDL